MVDLSIAMLNYQSVTAKNIPKTCQEKTQSWIPPGVVTIEGSGVSCLPFYVYHLVMTHIAMENPHTKWWFIAGKIIYFYGPSWLPWLC